MEFEKVKELIETVNLSDISLFELKTDDIFVKIDKSLNRNDKDYVEKPVERIKENNEVIKEKTAMDITKEKINEENIKPIDNVDEDKDLVVVKAPMVGTFYESPSQDAESFVSVGGNVKVGDTLCIIEAMKLMNEIESQVNGIVKKVLVKNGEMVEYGQPIFMVKEE